MGIAGGIRTAAAAEPADDLALVEAHQRGKGRVCAVDITAVQYFDMGHLLYLLFRPPARTDASDDRSRP